MLFFFFWGEDWWEKFENYFLNWVLILAHEYLKSIYQFYLCNSTSRSDAFWTLNEYLEK